MSSILSSNASRISAVSSASGGKQANSESLDQSVGNHSIGMQDSQSRIHSVPAQPRSGGASVAYAPNEIFNHASQALADWPSVLDSSLDAEFRSWSLPTLSRSYELGKRLFDLGLAVLIAPVVGALIAIIAAAIAVTTGNPIFFRHRRIGRHGREFNIWKFRTMHVDSERHLAEHLQHHPDAREEWRLTHKLKTDPRVTRLGRFLRKTSLDELPQIFNIFAGNMSFVGPRPITHAETAKYADRLPCYLAALPGITGLWQVSGRCDLSYESRVALDETYVRQWSIARDLAILLKTPRAVFCRNGAY